MSWSIPQLPEPAEGRLSSSLPAHSGTQRALQSKRRSSGAFQGFLASGDVSKASSAVDLVEHSSQSEQACQSPEAIGREVVGTSSGTTDVLGLLREARPKWSDVTLFDAEAKLAQVGIWSIKELAGALEGRLNTRLRDAGLKAFKPETLYELRKAVHTRLKMHAGSIDRIGSKPAHDELLTEGESSAIWIAMDGELPSAEGLLNQVDMEIDYDVCWSQTFSPERGPDEASTEQCGSGSESCTREGLLNQLDLDEDYDADWCCQSLSHVYAEDRPERIVEVVPVPKQEMAERPSAVDRIAGASGARWTVLARKASVDHTQLPQHAARRQAHQDISSREVVEVQRSARDASREARSSVSVVGFADWLASKEACGCPAILDRADGEAPREPCISFGTWLAELEQSQAKSCPVPTHELAALLGEPRPALEDLPRSAQELAATPDEPIPALGDLLRCAHELSAGPDEPIPALDDLLLRSAHELAAVPDETIPALDDLLRSIDLADAEKIDIQAEASEPKDDIVEVERKARDRLLQRFKDAEEACVAD